MTTLAAARPNFKRAGFSSNPTVFGAILRGELPAAVLYEDDEVLAFRDAHPVSEHHYLVIPKALVPHAAAMTSADMPLLRKLVRVATQIARANGVEDVSLARDAGTLSMGFHRWPFITVSHLHLHLIWPHPASMCIKAWQHPAKNGWLYPSPEKVAQWVGEEL
eukprot:CAMPEP_0183344748 /NCGR_PEP_ID=MMETSP0164_2-20130417/10347_1 /TAXON_ID=221442 /ORGANISM="Coccolithus pelagicus ssp braarudi, Strain PLY182g" /LENGTH=162 /DNA_ID=CAMNT_0025515797 /DNA_START=28 /DNA_END=516 /DNA_ORIENTATION=-